MINAVSVEDFQKMFDKGYKVVPVGESTKGYGKRPLIEGWESYPWDKVDPYDEADRWFRDIGHRISGMGVLCGPDSGGLACIDIDSDDEETIDRICKYFHSPVMKRGGKGIALFYQTDGKHNRASYRFNVPSGGMVEVFYDRRQIVIPPSWYKDDHCYEWVGGVALWDIDVDDLPVLNTEQIENLQTLIGSASVATANLSLPKSHQFKDGMNRTIIINKLTGALIGDSASPDLNRIVSELLIYDAKYFGDNSFFLDPRKAHNKSTSRSANCMTYVSSMMRTVHNKTGQLTETMFITDSYNKAIRFNHLSPVTDRIEKMYDGMPEFNSDLIPPLWRSMIEEVCVAQGMPRQGVFMAMFTSLGASLQGNVIIKPLTGEYFFRRTNLACAMVATSGSKKSDIVYSAIRELTFIDNELKTINSRELLTKIQDIEGKIETLTREKRKSGSDVDSINQEIFSLQDELEKNPAKGTIFLYENAPIQKMILDAKRNQKTGLFLIKDEMKQIFSDFRKKGNEDARTFYMKGLDGNTNFSYSTISRGTDYIKDFYVSLLTNIQPDVLSSYIKELHAGKGENDGFLQRIILVPFGEPQAVKPTSLNYDKFNKEYAIFRNAFYSPDVEACIAPEAIDTYNEMRFTIRTKATRYHHLPVGSFLAKHEGLLCVIAYLYQYMKNPEKKPTEIGYDSLIDAMKLLDYLGEASKFLFDIRDHVDTQQALAQVANLIIRKHFRDGCTQAEMHKSSGTVCKSPTVFYDILRELEVRGYVYLEKVTESSITVHINPEVYLL